MNHSPAGPTPLAFDEARQMVIDTVRSIQRSLKVESVDLEEAYGRVLADELTADRDYPALRRSLRDGFAVRAIDVPGILSIRGEVRAGEAEQSAIGESEAVEIMTGAAVPPGADAVVMIEHTIRTSVSSVRTDRGAQTGQFINEQGAEARNGSLLISAGTKLDGSHVATLAMSGRTTVRVFGRPSVAVLATGDEIVELREQPAIYQVRNSNSYMLATLVRAAGGKPTILPIARDTKEALGPLLERGLQHDMLVISGGVSAGKYDLVKPTLQEMGVQFCFERVRVQPGQPTAFGILNNKPVFGLPGNPGSSLITFELFARSAVEVLGGQSKPVLPLLQAQFEAPFRHKLGLTRFLPALLSEDGQHLRHIPWQGSSDVPALARANVFLVAEEDREAWDTGDSIRVMRKP